MNNKKSDGIKVFSHIHSKYSFDSLNDIKKIIKICRSYGADVVIISDHNTIDGSLESLMYSNVVKIITAEEFATDVGDIIGLFIKEDIPHGNVRLSKVKYHWKDVIPHIKRNNGLVMLPHPYRSHSLLPELIEECDIIETFNSRCLPEENRMAEELAEKYGKPTLAGSDAHFLGEIKNAYTIFKWDDIENEESIKEMLLKADRIINGRTTGRFNFLMSQVIKILKEKDYRTLPKLLLRYLISFTKRRVEKK